MHHLHPSVVDYVQNHHGSTKNVTRPRKKSAASSLSATIRHRQSVAGSGGMRWFNTTSFCDLSKSATGTVEYVKLSRMGKNCGRLFLTFWFQMYLPDNFTSQQFSTIFKSKVDVIRSSTTGSSAPAVPESCQSTLHSYWPISVPDLTRLLSIAPNKQCGFDPCPTRLVKFLPIISHILTKVVNTSLQSG